MAQHKADKVLEQITALIILKGSFFPQRVQLCPADKRLGLTRRAANYNTAIAANLIQKHIPGHLRDITADMSRLAAIFDAQIIVRILGSIFHHFHAVINIKACLMESQGQAATT